MYIKVFFLIQYELGGGILLISIFGGGDIFAYSVSFIVTTTAEI